MNNERKTAIVTGGAKGIGKAIAVKLATDGFNVIINYNGSESAAKDTAALCEKEGVDTLCIKADVSNYKEVQVMIKQVLEKFKRIDVLVNNSGITKDSLLLGMKENDFDSVINVNLKGCFNTIKHIVPIMLKQKSGNIINIASVVGITGNAGQANYAASKAGVIGLTKSTAKELASRNIRCNAIAPGFIETDMTSVLSENVLSSIMDMIPLKKSGKPEDVAEMVSFLASDKSSYVTGQVIHVDGGMVI